MVADHVAKVVADPERTHPLNKRPAVFSLGLHTTPSAVLLQEAQRCAPWRLRYLRIGSERPCAPISQLWSNRVNWKSAPSKRASRRSHPIKLAHRRSAPEKSAATSETLWNSASRKFALEKSTLFSSASRQTRPERCSFSLAVKIRCVPSSEKEQPLPGRTQPIVSAESFFLGIFTSLVVVLSSFT